MGVAEEFSAAMRARDFEALGALLADDVVVHSPITARLKFEGRGEVLSLLEDVRGSFESLDYTTSTNGDGTAVLAFDAVVKGRELQGVDIMRLDPDGRVREITVFVRPLPGIATFAADLAPRLAGRRGRMRAILAKVAVGPLVIFNRIGDAIGVWLVRPKSS